MPRIIIGLIMIIGGLTGTLTLKGTGSSIGLAVVGLVFSILGIVEMSSSNKEVQSKRKSSRSGKQERDGSKSSKSRQTRDSRNTRSRNTTRDSSKPETLKNSNTRRTRKKTI